MCLHLILRFLKGCKAESKNVRRISGLMSSSHKSLTRCLSESLPKISPPLPLAQPSKAELRLAGPTSVSPFLQTREIMALLQQSLSGSLGVSQVTELERVGIEESSVLAQGSFWKDGFVAGAIEA